MSDRLFSEGTGDGTRELLSFDTGTFSFDEGDKLKSSKKLIINFIVFGLSLERGGGGVWQQC